MALPKTFTGGERLFAGDLNDNFEALDTLLGTAVQSSDVSNIVVLTQAAYDGLSPDANTLYLITD